MPIATPAQAAAALGLTGFGAASNSSPVTGEQLGHRLGQGVPHDPHLARVEGQEEHGEDRNSLGHVAPREREKCRERDDGEHGIESQQSAIAEGRECLCEPRRIDVCELDGQRGRGRIDARVANPSWRQGRRGRDSVGVRDVKPAVMRHVDGVVGVDGHVAPAGHRVGWGREVQDRRGDKPAPGNDDPNARVSRTNRWVGAAWPRTTHATHTIQPIAPRSGG